jgi:hypothetical protein
MDELFGFSTGGVTPGETDGLLAPNCRAKFETEGGLLSSGL